MSVGMEFTTKMSSIIRAQAQKVAPAVHKIITNLVSLGFNIATLPDALRVAALMGNGFDQFLKGLNEADWNTLYTQSTQESGVDDYVNVSHGYDVNPKVVGKSVMHLLQTLRDSGLDISNKQNAINSVSSSWETFNPEALQELGSLTDAEYTNLLGMLGPRVGMTMKRLMVAQQVSDGAAGFLSQLFNIGFRVWDHNVAKEALAMISQNQYAKELLSVPPEMWKPLVNESLYQAPKKEKAPPPPAVSEEPNIKMPDVIKPQVPADPPAQAAPPPPAAPQQPAGPAISPMGWMLSSIPAFKRLPRGNAGLQHIVNNFDEIVSYLPPGINKGKYGDILPVGILPPTSSLGSNATESLSAGDDVRVYKAPPFTGVAVGTADDGRLALLNDAGQLMLVDPIGAEVRKSARPLKPKHDY